MLDGDRLTTLSTAVQLPLSHNLGMYRTENTISHSSSTVATIPLLLCIDSPTVSLLRVGSMLWKRYLIAVAQQWTTFCL
jgi:hypothetical protein